jgi:hypothetical protein
MPRAINLNDSHCALIPDEEEGSTTPLGMQILSKQIPIHMARYQSVLARRKHLSRGEFQH